MMTESRQTFTELLQQFNVMGSQKSILEALDKILDDKSGGYFVALNPEKILNAYRDEELKKILSSSNFLFIDGIGAKYAYWILLGKIFERVGGIDLMNDLLQLANQKHLKVGLLGAKEESVQKTHQILAQQYPNITFVFAQSGYGESLNMAVEQINQTKPDLVLVAMGSPAQEKWISQHCASFPGTLFTGVGGTFDVISGKTIRAPLFLRKMGLEWLFRFLLQPIKRFKRMLNLFYFTLLALKGKIFR